MLPRALQRTGQGGGIFRVTAEGGLWKPQVCPSKGPERAPGRWPERSWSGALRWGDASCETPSSSRSIWIPQVTRIVGGNACWGQYPQVTESWP